MRRELPEGLRDLLEEMRVFVQKAVDEHFPASAVTLEALRKYHPELAKAVFAEAVIGPAKRAIGEHITEEALARLEELEDRLWQEPITNLYRDVETIVSSRLLHGIFESCLTDIAKMRMGEADASGKLTDRGVWLAEALAKDVAEMLGRLATVRERRVQILLAGALLGKDVVQEAVKTYSGYHRGALLASVHSWLGLQKISENRRTSLMERLEGKPDEIIELFLDKLEGTAFLHYSHIEKMARELLDKEEYIEF